MLNIWRGNDSNHVLFPNMLSCLVFTIVHNFSGHPVHHRPNMLHDSGPHHLRGETAFLTSFKNGWTRKKWGCFSAGFLTKRHLSCLLLSYFCFIWFGVNWFKGQRFTVKVLYYLCKLKGFHSRTHTTKRRAVKKNWKHQLSSHEFH